VLTPVDMEEALTFCDETMTALREGLVAATQADAGSGALASAVERLCAEAREQEHPPERMVTALRLAWRLTPRPPLVPAEHWRAVYQDALARSLAIHFATAER
jgi:predicted RNA-binding protein associated with RNAse of E/G family